MNKRIHHSRLILAIGVCSMALMLTGCGKGKKAYEKGVSLAEAGDYVKAAEQFEKAVSENQEKAEYYISYGMTLNQLNRYSEAITQFEMGRQDTQNSIANENNKQICCGEAVAWFNLGDYQKVIELCTEGVKYKEPKQLNNNLKSTHAAALQMLGKNEEALSMYNEILEKDKKIWDVYIKRAGLKEQMGDYEGARTDYLEVINGSADAYDAYFGLYHLYFAQGQKSEAKKVLENLLAGSAKTPEDICQFGKASFYLGDFDSAAASLEEAREAGNVEANYYLGMVHMKQEDYESALNCFEAYLKVNEYPESAMVYNQMAGCYIEQGDYEQALEYLNTGLNRSDAMSRQVLLKNQVLLYEKMGKYKVAGEYAQNYLEMYPSDDGMVKELKFIQTRIKKKAKADATDETDSTDDGSSTDSSSADQTGSTEAGTSGTNQTVSTTEPSDADDTNSTAEPSKDNQTDEKDSDSTEEPSESGNSSDSRGGYADVSDGEDIVTDEDVAR